LRRRRAEDDQCRRIFGNLEPGAPRIWNCYWIAWNLVEIGATETKIATRTHPLAMIVPQRRGAVQTDFSGIHLLTKRLATRVDRTARVPVPFRTPLSHAVYQLGHPIYEKAQKCHSIRVCKSSNHMAARKYMYLSASDVQKNHRRPSHLGLYNANRGTWVRRPLVDRADSITFVLFHLKCDRSGRWFVDPLY